MLPSVAQLPPKVSPAAPSFASSFVSNGVGATAAALGASVGGTICVGGGVATGVADWGTGTTGDSVWTMGADDGSDLCTGE